MATLAHPTSGGFGPASQASTTEAVLDRAIAAAVSYLQPRGLLQRLTAAPRSAGALVQRYRLRAAIDAAYAHIVRELGPVHVEMSAEESAGAEYLAMDCFTTHGDLDHVIEVEDAVQREVHGMLGDGRWMRLLVSINPGAVDVDCT